jgi:hypothetical protein
VTLRPRDSRSAASDADAMPLPNEDTTPPVTKTNLVISRAGAWHSRLVEILIIEASEVRVSDRRDVCPTVPRCQRVA